jgi:integrase/recombinase XerD
MVLSPTIPARNAAFAAEYLEWQRKRNRSRETLVAYTDVLNKLLVWLGETPLATASTRQLEGFVERPRARRRPGHPTNGKMIEGSPATRRRDITVIRSFYKYLTERGYLAVNPALLLVPPTVNNVAPKAIDDNVWRAVWCHPRLTETERVVLALGFFCGLRRQELVDLTPANFDLDGERLVSFVRKGGNEASFPYGSAIRLHAERMPQLVPEGADEVLRQIRAYVEGREGRPFLLAWGDDLGRPDDPALRGRQRLDHYQAGWTPPGVVNKRLRTLLRRCGLPADAFSPHALRHSMVTNLLRANVPLQVVSRMASHADLTTTMRYVRTAEDPLAEFLSQPLPRQPRYA